MLERAHKATEGLEELEVIFCEQAEDAEHKAAEAAERIVQYSDNPDSEEFKAAVRERRNFLELADYNKTLAGRVSGYMTAARVGVYSPDAIQRRQEYGTNCSFHQYAVYRN